jgi:hypothetical protein
MIVFRRRLAETGAMRRHTVGIVETDQPVAVRVMQRKAVPQTMRTFRRYFRAPDLEFQPISLVEQVDAAIEGKQEFKRVLV